MIASSTTLDDPTETLSSPQSLGSPFARKTPSEIPKVYDQATALFLTRRLPEALSKIEPLISISPSSNGDSNDEDRKGTALVAQASRSWRTKVWNFYLTLLNAIVELGPEDGKAALGNKEWKDLVAKIQRNTIWEEVVNAGYGGDEGSVDADVVINLVTLLLAQSSTQPSTQQYLENYLSASSGSGRIPAEPFNGSTSGHVPINGMTSQSRENPNTPRDLNSRIKILELYSLHVLPLNGEWNYARDFINMNELLDEESKESFLQTLQNLEDDDSKAHDLFEDAVPQQDSLADHQTSPVEDVAKRSKEAIWQPSTVDHHRPDKDTDYGIDNTHSPQNLPKSRSPTPKSTIKPVKSVQTKTTRTPPTNTSRKGGPSIYKHSIAFLSILQNAILNMSDRMSRNPMPLLRFMLFLIGLIVALSRRDVKDRLRKLTGAGWDKIRKTAGMGVKVSYI